MLLSLPEELVAEILFNWLRLQDLARFDSAICQKFSRSDFLSILSSERYAYQYYFFWEDQELRWIVDRKVHIANIEGHTTKDQMSLAKALFSFSGAAMRTINIDGQRQFVNENTQGDQRSTNSDGDVLLIAQHCPRLQSLSIVLSDTVVNDSSFIELARNCTYLRELDLHNISITDASLQAIAQYLPRLTSFSIAYCMNITVCGLVATAGRCRQLEFLDLTESTDTVIEAFARGCTKLKTLLLYDCNKLTDNSIVALSQQCSCLARLDVNILYGDVNKLITGAGTTLCRLESLDLNYTVNAGDVMLHSIAQYCPLLIEIVICTNHRVTDDGIAALARCCSLKLLYIDECRAVRGAGLVKVVQNCKSLEKLHVSGNRHVNDLIVESILQLLLLLLQEGRPLHRITFSGCSELSPEMLCRVKEWDAKHRKDERFRL